MNRLEEMKKRFNGCPLFDGREKGKLEELEGKAVKINDYYKLSGDEGAYYAFTVEDNDKTFLSCGSITALLDEFGDDAIGVSIKIGEKVKTKSKRDYRPITIL